MNKRDPKLTVLLFNESINKQNIEELAALMSDNYVFIDSTNSIHKGLKADMVKEWQDFFNLYPDYINHFVSLESRDDLVIITGYSTCLFKPLDGPAIWTAKVENDLITEWRVYLDDQANRELLDL